MYFLVNSTDVENTSCFPQTTIDSIVTTTSIYTRQGESNYSNTHPISMTTAPISQMTVSTMVYSCADGSFGVYCNISSDSCTILTPCLNGGTCYSNAKLSLGYSCSCASGFSGDDCDVDDRVCTENTCW